MPLLSFTLSEEGVNIFHDILVCLHKFSETVYLEARQGNFKLSTFNSTKSAYACVSFDTNRFFSKYGFTSQKEKFHCVMGIHSLLPVFSRKSTPGFQAVQVGDSAIDRCDVTIEDDIGRHSRFIARVFKRSGIGATHRLPFEPLPPAHAKFDMDAASNKWKASARVLRQLIDHFSPGTELLDIHLDDTTIEDADPVINFRCFTEKTVSGDHVLKKPLHTSIAVAADEFDEMDVEENLHIIITVKDFKSIVLHAYLINTDITACFSNPSNPIHLSYAGDGFTCKFLLTTVGERAGDGSRRKKTKQNGHKSDRQALEAASRSGSSAPPRSATPVAPGTAAPMTAHLVSVPTTSVRDGTQPTAMMPRGSTAFDPRSRNWLNLRPDNMRRPPRPTIDDDSLFVTQNDEDDEEGRWEPVNDDREGGDGEAVGWGASGFNASNQISASLGTMNRVSVPDATIGDAGDGDGDETTEMPSGLEPTQRLSDVQRFGLFGV